MAQFNAQNERVKRRFLGWMKDADGKDEKTLDRVAAALRDFEMALGCKPFKAFHLDWGRRYKTNLEKCRHHRTGKPLSLSTRGARLRHVKAFFKWLAFQPGFKSRVSVTDGECFPNNDKDARAAHARRPAAYPSLEQCAHAFRLMPDETGVDRRDRVIFTGLLLTGARDGALASLGLKHVDLVEGKIIQDGREVKTKGSKFFESWFFPVDAIYCEAFKDWVRQLREDRLFGPSDALFPKAEVGWESGRFANTGLSREPYANSQAVRTAVKAAFRNAGLPEFTPHSFRKTLAMLGDEVCTTMEERKAWSQSLRHEHLATTISACMPVSRERQGELLRRLK